MDAITLFSFIQKFLSSHINPLGGKDYSVKLRAPREGWKLASCRVESGTHTGGAEAPLRALLTDYANGSPLARLRAAMLLGDFGGPTAEEDLKGALTAGKESNAAVRSEIIGSLGRLGRKDVVVDYYNSGSEKSPSATAAIALALQGGTDDKSKLALAHLLTSSDNERVYKATFLAIEKSYEPVLKSQADASGKKFDFVKVISQAGIK